MQGSAQVKLLRSQYLVVWQSGSTRHSGTKEDKQNSLLMGPPKSTSRRHTDKRVLAKTKSSKTFPRRFQSFPRLVIGQF